jgi:hypothetical protein
LTSTRLTLAFTLCTLAACAVRSVPLVPAPVAAALFTQANAEVARLGAGSNEARFEALTALLTERGIAFQVEPFTITPRKNDPRTNGRNIAVTLPGREPGVVIGAHYDAVRLVDGSFSKGAVDNAASVVVLVRVIEELEKRPASARISVVFFDMEELGLLGSARYIQDHPDQRPRAMVNLDVNAYGDTQIFGPRTAANDALFQAADAACLAVTRACIELARMPPSDDISYQKAGIPAVSIASVPRVDAHQLWLFVNGGKDSGLANGFQPGVLRTIHSAADTPSLVESTTLARVYRIVVGLVRRLAK